MVITFKPQVLLCIETSPNDRCESDNKNELILSYFQSGLSKRGQRFNVQSPLFKIKTMDNIKTQKTHADPELANITFVDWLAIIRKLADQMGTHPVLCEDHKKLLKGRP